MKSLLFLLAQGWNASGDKDDEGEGEGSGKMIVERAYVRRVAGATEVMQLWYVNKPSLVSLVDNMMDFREIPAENLSWPGELFGDRQYD